MSVTPEQPRARFRVVAAVHLILLRGGRVLLLRRCNTGFEDGKYSLPAGHLDGEEPARVAMAREAREETGIHVEPQDLRLVHVMHRQSREERVDCFFTADRWMGEPRITEPDKCDAMKWYPTGRLPDAMVSYVTVAIQHSLDGAVFSEFGWE